MLCCREQLFVRTHSVFFFFLLCQQQEIEKAIKRQKMGKSKCMSSENAPGWEEKLASDSEAFIKADRSKTSDMKTLQDETVECLESEEKDNASKTSQD